jgi:hypothetical protein
VCGSGCGRGKDRGDGALSVLSSGERERVSGFESDTVGFRKPECCGAVTDAVPVTVLCRGAQCFSQHAETGLEDDRAQYFEPRSVGRLHL